MGRLDLGRPLDFLVVVRALISVDLTGEDSLLTSSLSLLRAAV